MNILHLLSQNHLTGAEVYAAQLCEQQKQLGHNVIQVSNGFFTETTAHKIQFTVETRSRWQFIKNIFLFRRLLLKNEIQVIHCHSRASAKLAYWSRLGLKIGMVSTVHGRQNPSLSKKIWNTYGDILIPVCESIENQLIHSFNYNPARIRILRNPISNKNFHFSKKTIAVTSHLKDRKIKIAVVGRTTGPKGTRSEQILNSLPAVLKNHGIQAEYYLVGGKKSDLKLSNAEFINEIYCKDLTTSNYEDYDLVIGSGRVALEALITGCPLIAFGEASYEGLITKENIRTAYYTNFGDIHPATHFPTLDSNRLNLDILQFLQDLQSSQDRQWMSELVQNDFSSEKIARKIVRVYESSYFLRNYHRWIPVLMYHKIPDLPLQSQHQIFVTKPNFEKHLQFYKLRGFTTLTFNELKDFKSGAKDFKYFPKKPLVLTFDDGYRDNFENASPLLTKYGFKAQLFLLADSKVASNFWDHSETETPHDIVSGADRKQWATTAFEIGSHGFSHRKITEMTEIEARAELKNSKSSLESELQQKISVYAFTYGDTNLKSAELALEEGYDYAVNTDSGGLLLEESPYQIFRVNIFPNETWISLYKKTSSWYRNYYFKKRKK